MSVSYNITCPRGSWRAISQILNFFEFVHKYSGDTDDGKVIAIKTVGESTKTMITTVEMFYEDAIAYETPRNLHFYPIKQKDEHVIDFKTTVLDIIRDNPILLILMGNKRFRNIFNYLNDFIMFRFARNKLERLYWFPSFNAGMPLSPKAKKDGAHELVFFMHDCGHHLLLDLIFTGRHFDEKAKNIYVIWRLIGEGMTVVLNEMLAVDYLKDFPAYRAANEKGYDHPYKFYRLIREMNPLATEEQIFKASCLFFSRINPKAFNNLLGRCELTPEQQVVYDGFMKRYTSVATRGEEWTISNFNRMAGMAGDYAKWFDIIEPHTKEFEQFDTVDQYYGQCSGDRMNIFEYLFRIAYERMNSAAAGSDIILNPHCRINNLFRRFMFGNILLLTKHNVNISEMVPRINNIAGPIDYSKEIEEIRSLYQELVDNLVVQSKLSEIEGLVYREMYLMIPPNILKK